MNDKFEASTGFKKALETIMKVSTLQAPKGDTAKIRKVTTFKVVGYEHRLRGGEEVLFLKNPLNDVAQEQLLFKDLKLIETTFVRLFGMGFKALRAPEVAALLELGYYIGPMPLNNIIGLRRAIASRMPSKIIVSILYKAPVVFKVMRDEPYKSRFARIIQQLKEGRFISIGKDTKTEPVKESLSAPAPATKTTPLPPTASGKSALKMFKRSLREEK